MKVDKSELRIILNVNLNNLKQIEKRKTLNKRLSEKGYALIDKYIENNKAMYEIEKSQTINNIYNIKKTKSFIKYFDTRTKEEAHSIEEIATKANVNKNTVTKWDNTLQDKKIIAKDGYYYFRLDKDENELSPVTIEEYKSFWKNKAYINAFKKLRDRYVNGEITLTEFQLASCEVAVIINTIENKYYYKIKKYKVDKNNKIYIDTLRLIEGYSD